MVIRVPWFLVVVDFPKGKGQEVGLVQDCQGHALAPLSLSVRFQRLRKHSDFSASFRRHPREVLPPRSQPGICGPRHCPLRVKLLLGPPKSYCSPVFNDPIPHSGHTPAPSQARFRLSVGADPRMAPERRSERVDQRRRRKIPLACEPCRERKSRCDGAKPICSTCQRRSLPLHHCVYTLENARTASNDTLVILL